MSASLQDFKDEMTAFLKEHKKSKLRLVDKIAETFQGNEGTVMQHLYTKYAPGETYNGMFKDVTPEPQPEPDEEPEQLEATDEDVTEGAEVEATDEDAEDEEEKREE